jgi:hypothetical protein
MARPPVNRMNHAAVSAAIAAELRRLFADVLRSPIPAAMADLIRQLDRSAGSDGNGGDRGPRD